MTNSSLSLYLAIASSAFAWAEPPSAPFTIPPAASSSASALDWAAAPRSTTYPPPSLLPKEPVVRYYSPQAASIAPSLNTPPTATAPAAAATAPARVVVPAPTVRYYTPPAPTVRYYAPPAPAARYPGVPASYYYSQNRASTWGGVPSRGAQPTWSGYHYAARPVTPAQPVVVTNSGTAYRPASPVIPMPENYYVGSGMIGQPKLYVDGQPVRNFFRYVTP